LRAIRSTASMFRYAAKNPKRRCLPPLDEARLMTWEMADD
jgi:hypothetical protein